LAAVELVTIRGLSAREVAGRYGVTERSIRRWVSETEAV
jgi:transposase